MTKNLQRAAWVVAVVLFVIGLYGLYQRLTLGHASANYGSYIPWGLWIAAYVYLIGLSAGAFLFSTLVYVFNVHRSGPESRSQLESVGRLALFIAAGDPGGGHDHGLAGPWSPHAGVAADLTPPTSARSWAG